MEPKTDLIKGVEQHKIPKDEFTCIHLGETMEGEARKPKPAKKKGAKKGALEEKEVELEPKTEDERIAD